MSDILYGLKIFPECEKYLKEIKTYEYKKNNFNIIDAEFSVVEINGNKLIGEFK